MVTHHSKPSQTQSCLSIHPHLFKVHQGGWVSAEPLQLLLGGESRGCLTCSGDVRARQKGYVKNCLEVSHKQLHHQGLVGVIYQRREGHLCIFLLRLDQRRSKDNPQVACSHFIFLCLFRHSVEIKSNSKFRLWKKHYRGCPTESKSSRLSLYIKNVQRSCKKWHFVISMSCGSIHNCLCKYN